MKTSTHTPSLIHQRPHFPNENCQDVAKTFRPEVSDAKTSNTTGGRVQEGESGPICVGNDYLSSSFLCPSHRSIFVAYTSSFSNAPQEYLEAQQSLVILPNIFVRGLSTTQYQLLWAPWADVMSANENSAQETPAAPAGEASRPAIVDNDNLACQWDKCSDRCPSAEALFVRSAMSHEPAKLTHAGPHL